MSRDKQIEEMAEIICQNTEFDTMWDEIYDSANALYNAGYRKASEVAEKIFAELDKRLDDITIVMGRLDSLNTLHKTMEAVTREVAELKKKYTGTTEGEG